MTYLNKIYSAIDYTRNKTAPWMTYASEKCTQATKIATIAARTICQYVQVRANDLPKVDKKEVFKMGCAGIGAGVLYATISQMVLAYNGEESDAADNPIQAFFISAVASNLIVLTKFFAISKVYEKLPVSYNAENFLEKKMGRCAIVFATHTMITLAMSAASRMLVSPLIGESTARRMAMITAFANSIDNLAYTSNEEGLLHLSILPTIVYALVSVMGVPLICSKEVNQISAYNIAKIGTCLLGICCIWHKKITEAENPPTRLSKVPALVIGPAFSVSVGITTAFGRNFFKASAVSSALFSSSLICINTVHQTSRFSFSFTDFWHLHSMQYRREYFDLMLKRVTPIPNVVIDNIITGYLGKNAEDIEPQAEIIG